MKKLAEKHVSSRFVLYAKLCTTKNCVEKLFIKIFLILTMWMVNVEHFFSQIVYDLL